MAQSLLRLVRLDDGAPLKKCSGMFDQAPRVRCRTLPRGKHVKFLAKSNGDNAGVVVHFQVCHAEVWSRPV